MSDVQKYQGPESPFDKIRQVDADGNEFWSARDMQPVMAYPSWDKFLAVIERARQALINTGEDLDVHISLQGKLVQIGLGLSKEIVDYRLTRYGAYFVALNGDPSKSENAVAQAYFVINTRQNELQKQFQIPKTLPEALIRYAEALIAQEAAELKALEAEAKALEASEEVTKLEDYKKFKDAEGTFAMKQVATQLSNKLSKPIGPNIIHRVLRHEGIIYPSGPFKNEPYQEFTKYLVTKARTRPVYDSEGNKTGEVKLGKSQLRANGVTGVNLIYRILKVVLERDGDFSASIAS